jgi:ATP-dependent exoDNAse (exonuclease V) beta subunit
MEKSILKLEASAGSGKTYCLALEYLGRLLLAFAGKGKRTIDPKRERELLGSVLAITFTVKAAQEMKGRIVEKLKHFALSNLGHELNASDKEFLAQLADETSLSADRIISLSGDLIELVLASYDDFNVKTIDSLMSAMVKVIAPDLALPADYEIAIDAREELETRARALLADLADRDWPRIEKTIASLKKLSANTGWKIDDALGKKLIELFHLSMRQGIPIGKGADKEHESLPVVKVDDFKRNLENLLKILLEEPREGYKNRFLNANKVNPSLVKEMEACQRGELDLFSLEQLLMKPFFKKDDPREFLKKGAPEPYATRLSAAYGSTRSCQQELIMELSILKTFPQREFFPDFTTAWNHDKETLFVEEFSQTLARLFEQWVQEAFPYLYMKMSDRFRNFLFDEFQDTSTLQFKALAPLIDEVLSREKKASIFIVGDRKQAIYRWRGGNSELMDEDRLREEIPAIGHLNQEEFSATLGTNWRSCKEIIEFNNTFWDPEAISRIVAEADLQEAIKANFHASHQELPAGAETAGGYVELSLQVEAENAAKEESGETDGEEEARSAVSGQQLVEIENTIGRLHEHGFKYSEIAVLLRKNDQVRSVVRHLCGKGIASISDQSLMLDSNPRVNEIIAFFKFLDYPPDNLNFFTFVSGGIFLAAAEEHFPVDKNKFSEELFINCHGPFYKLFQDKFPDCWKGLIEPFFQAVGFLPPYDLFSDITQAFNVYENFSGDTPFLQALGDVLHRSEREGGSSISGFLRHWRKMVEDEETPAVTIPENSTGVRVLTMHQSKGLEFPAVIVPLNDRKGRNDDNLHSDAEGIFYINSAYAQAHPVLKEKYQKENIRSSIDLLNLLYVAFTRAKEALFIPVVVKDKVAAPARSADGLIKKIAKASNAVVRHPLLAWTGDSPDRLYRRGELEKKEGKPTKETTPAGIRSKKLSTRSWQARYLVFKKADFTECPDRSGAERGERIHDLLSRLGKVADPGQLDAWVRQMAASAGWPESDIQAVASYLGRNEVFRLLSGGREVHLEKEVVDNKGAFPEFRRLDRLQVNPDAVQVIDFKTGKEKSEKYISQMQEYIGAVRPLFPGRRCSGFLLYIDRGEIEEVTCSS